MLCLSGLFWTIFSLAAPDYSSMACNSDERIERSFQKLSFLETEMLAHTESLIQPIPF